MNARVVTGLALAYALDLFDYKLVVDDVIKLSVSGFVYNRMFTSMACVVFVLCMVSQHGNLWIHHDNTSLACV